MLRKTENRACYISCNRIIIYIVSKLFAITSPVSVAHWLCLKIKYTNCKKVLSFSNVFASTARVVRDSHPFPFHTIFMTTSSPSKCTPSSRPLCLQARPFTFSSIVQRCPHTTAEIDSLRSSIHTELVARRTGQAPARPPQTQQMCRSRTKQNRAPLFLRPLHRFSLVTRAASKKTLF